MRKKKNKLLSIIVTLSVFISCLVGYGGELTVAEPLNHSFAAKTVDSHDGIVKIPLSWSTNAENHVNYGVNTTSNAFTGNYQSVGKTEVGNIWSYSNGEYYLNKNNENLQSGVLRIPSMVGNGTYNIPYNNLMSWFNANPVYENGYYMPKTLPVSGDIWKEYTPVQGFGWNDTSNPWNTTDWRLFRGITNFKNINVKEPNGQVVQGINPNDYEFFLANYNPDYMFLAFNDGVSVFVDGNPTDINYMTNNLGTNVNAEHPPKLIFENSQGQQFDKQAKIGSWFGGPYFGPIYNPTSVGKSTNALVNGWHIDLNKVGTIDGSTVLGNVTSQIRDSGYGPNNEEHVVDMLGTEYCQYGGLTRLALYAVKKPAVTFKKIAYIMKNGNEVDLTDGEKVPLNIPVYFKFIVTNNSNSTTLTNLNIKDVNNEMKINQTIDSKSNTLYKYTITSEKDANGTWIASNTGDLSKLEPGERLIIKGNAYNPLKYNNLSLANTANGELDNVATLNANYFNNNLKIKPITANASFTPITPPPVTINKNLISAVRGNKSLPIIKNTVYVPGDKLTYEITLVNKSRVSQVVSLKDDLSGVVDGKEIYNKTTGSWTFTCNNPDYINPGCIILSPGDTVNIKATWTIPDISNLSTTKVTPFVNKATLYNQNGTQIGESSVSVDVAKPVYKTDFHKGIIQIQFPKATEVDGKLVSAVKFTPWTGDSYNPNKLKLEVGDKVQFRVWGTNSSTLLGKPFELYGISLKDNMCIGDSNMKLSFNGKNEGVEVENGKSFGDLGIKFENGATYIGASSGNAVPTNYDTNWWEITPEIVATIEKNGGTFINTAKIYSNDIPVGHAEAQPISILPNTYNMTVKKIVDNYNNLTTAEKDYVNGQYFYINLKDNNTGNIQTVAVKGNNGEAEFKNLESADSYTISECIPMNYKFVEMDRKNQVAKIQSTKKVQNSQSSSIHWYSPLSWMDSLSKNNNSQSEYAKTNENEMTIKGHENVTVDIHNDYIINNGFNDRETKINIIKMK